jgi:hypothetical protein
MLVIYQDTRDFLSVRNSRFKECLGLFFCGITLLVLSLPLLLLDKSNEIKTDEFWLFFILYLLYGSPFGVAGYLMVFKQNKFNFLVAQRLVMCWEGYRQTNKVPFDEIDSINVTYSQTGRGLIKIVTKSGMEIMVTRGMKPEMCPLADRIGQVTGAPVVHSAFVR